MFKPPNSELLEKVNTYTDHPAYQQPVVRSELHNRIRFALGWLVMLVSCAAILVFVFEIGFSLYLIGERTFEGFHDRLEFTSSLSSLAFGVFGLALTLRIGQWGRHLTRPHSREFV